MITRRPCLPPFRPHPRTPQPFHLHESPSSRSDRLNDAALLPAPTPDATTDGGNTTPTRAKHQALPSPGPGRVRPHRPGPAHGAGPDRARPGAGP